MKKGQVSIEFLAVFSFAFLMLIPLIIIFFDQTNEIQDAVAESQLKNVGIKIKDKAEIVYYSGEPSKATIEADFPDNIVSIVILPATPTKASAIIFGYRGRKNKYDTIVVPSLINLTGNLSINSGYHIIQVTSQGGGVLVTES
ncbi:MAG: hypothetical protein HGA85_01760 [Nanoarchaeota archaeon]|nr:hypothetical protein [Nanoarchaeota archaeon]